MTTKDLLAAHNELAREAGRPELADWRRSKAELETRIEAMRPDPLDMGEEPEPTSGDTTEPAVTEEAPEPVSARKAKPSISKIIAELLADASLSYDRVAALVRERVPGSATSARSVASIALRLRKGGAVIPARVREPRVERG